jgi:predicted GNAT superfamily acetyltransferase
VAPLHILVTAQKNGGLVAGAFDPSGQMVGFIFGFLGLAPDGQLKHCSHMMGVVPSLRRQGLGAALKWFQRDFVQEQGKTALITWTYDPLEGVNASLNITQLGGIVRTYLVSVYGDNMPDSLNQGLPSDRFEIEWWIKSAHVADCAKGEPKRLSRAALLASGAQIVNKVDLRDDGALVPAEMDLNLDSESLLVEIPAEFQAIKSVDMDLAHAWRMHTREIFQCYFERGYIVDGFISDREDGYRRNFYVLTLQEGDVWAF